MGSGHLNAQYNLRWPEDLKKMVVDSAKRNNRSMNADIVARLYESFERNNFDKSFLTTEELLEELVKRLSNLNISVKDLRE